MAFVEERIPKEDYYRFASLSKYRRETLTYWPKKWSIDRELDIFIVFFSGRRFVHITEYIDNPGKDFSQPAYFLMCNKGIFFGFEYNAKAEVIEAQTNEKEDGFILHLKDTNLFLRTALREQVSEYKLIAVKLIYGYFDSGGPCKKRQGPNKEIQMRKGIDIADPKITWFSDAEINIL